MEPKSNRLLGPLSLCESSPWTLLKKFRQEVGAEWPAVATGFRLTTITLSLHRFVNIRETKASPFELVMLAIIATMFRGTLMLIRPKPRR